MWDGGWAAGSIKTLLVNNLPKELLEGERETNKSRPGYFCPPPDPSFMPAYNPYPSSNYKPNPPQKLTQITLKPKQIKDHILKLHISSTFTTNPNSLLTEKAGKPVGITYRQTGMSWLINPLIAHAVLNPEDAGKFSPPLPSDRQLACIGHTP
jgi:hypothetical protein